MLIKKIHKDGVRFTTEVSGEHFSKTLKGPEFAVEGTWTCPAIAATIP